MSTANDTIVPVGRELEATVNNLSPGKTYNLRVLAYSNGGDGRMSSPTYVFQMGEFTRSFLAYDINFEDLILVWILVLLRCVGVKRVRKSCARTIW